MSMKAALAHRSPQFVRRTYQEAHMWLALLRSRNKQFLRFAPPGHFYSPIPDIGLLGPASAPAVDAVVDAIPGVCLNDEAQVDLLARFAEQYAEMPFPERPGEDCRYHLDNEFFSFGDGVVLYSMMRVFEPRRIVEIGSGFSSAAMLEIDERFFGAALDLTFIDPYPQRLMSLLSDTDTTRCKVVAEPVQDVPVEVYSELKAGDFLFIDSSHVAKASSDVLHLLFQVLPLLQEGVIVHVHDILWPFDYPTGWLRQGRAWNEAYLLRAFLQYNDAFEILYFNSYMADKHAELVERVMPLVMRVPTAGNTVGNSSIWLRKTTGPAL
jgi:predicted O-methyltransferase YrrM